MPMTKADVMQMNLASPTVLHLVHPEKGWYICLTVMSGAERDSYDSGHWEESKDGKVKYAYRNARARLAARTLCDEKGIRLFKDDEAEFLGTMRGGAPFLDWVYDEAKKLNKLTREDEAAIEKNYSEPEAKAASGTSSPGTSAEVLMSANGQ